MKNRILLLAIVASLFMMTSCDKESIDFNTTDKVDLLDELKVQLKADLEAYVTEHKEAKIEHLTLEELNKVFIENGLEPVTLKQLGMTPEDYENAQKAINDPSIAQDRCSGSGVLAVILGDMTGNGVLTAYDLTLAVSWYTTVSTIITSNTPIPYQYFALFTQFGVPNTGAGVIDGNDVTIATQAILGQISCFNLH